MSLRKAKLDRGTYQRIGELVRAFAEIEDIVSLYLYRLAGVSESMGSVMLGRTPISTRISQLEYIARLHGEDAAELHAELFDKRFTDTLKCRNVVAHGVFVGKGECDGRDLGYAFTTSDTVEPNTPMLTANTFICYKYESIAQTASYAKKLVTQLTDALGVLALREGRYEMPLYSHPKSRPPRKPNAKPKRPPQSSRP